MGSLGIFGRLASQLKSIGEGLFMGSDETGEILARDQAVSTAHRANNNINKRERKRPTLMKS